MCTLPHSTVRIVGLVWLDRNRNRLEIPCVCLGRISWNWIGILETLKPLPECAFNEFKMTDNDGLMPTETSNTRLYQCTIRDLKCSTYWSLKCVWKLANQLIMTIAIFLYVLSAYILMLCLWCYVYFPIKTMDNFFHWANKCKWLKCTL